MSPLTLALPQDPADRVAALEVLSALSGLDHPHIVRSPAERCGDSSVEVDTSPRPGPGLALLLAGRRLSPGQVVTVGVPIAQALDHAAAAGVHHGALDLASIVVDPDGRPMLVGVGLAQLAGAHPSAADDVHALARVLAALLDPDAGAEGAAVSSALAGALSGHPLTRPAPAALATQLLAATPPLALPAQGEPLRPVRTIHPPARRPRRRRPELPPRPVLIGVGIVIATLVVVVATRGHAAVEVEAQTATVASPTPSVSAGAPPAAPDWQAQLTALALARQRAYAQVEPTLLRDADAPGSAAAAIDRARVQQWASAGVYLRGDPAAVQLLSIVDSGAEVTVLTVRERTAAFDEVSRGTGAVVGHHAAGPARMWTVTLVATAKGWRTASVSAA